MCEPTFDNNNDNDNVQIVRRGRGRPTINKTPEEKTQAMRDCARKHQFEHRENRLMQQKALAEKKTVTLLTRKEEQNMHKKEEKLLTAN